MRHLGPVVVFEDIDDYPTRVDDPELDVDKSCVLVAKGYLGIPETGAMGQPAAPSRSLATATKSSSTSRPAGSSRMSPAKR